MYYYLSIHNCVYTFFRITRTTRTLTTSGSVIGGGVGENDELRESMQKIVDQFMTEERRAQ